MKIKYYLDKEKTKEKVIYLSIWETMKTFLAGFGLWYAVIIACAIVFGIITLLVKTL